MYLLTQGSCFMRSRILSLFNQMHQMNKLMAARIKTPFTTEQHVGIIEWRGKTTMLLHKTFVCNISVEVEQTQSNMQHICMCMVSGAWYNLHNICFPNRLSILLQSITVYSIWYYLCSCYLHFLSASKTATCFLCIIILLQPTAMHCWQLIYS